MFPVSCHSRSFHCPIPPSPLQQDLPPEVLNLTLAEFDQQYIPSEANPDDGERAVWVPCDQLDVEVEAACQQVGAAAGDVKRCVQQEACPDAASHAMTSMTAPTTLNDKSMFAAALHRDACASGFHSSSYLPICNSPLAQVEGEVMAYQLRVVLNCTHDAPVPHSDVASFIANATLAADSEEVVGGGWWVEPAHAGNNVVAYGSWHVAATKRTAGCTLCLLSSAVSLHARCADLLGRVHRPRPQPHTPGALHGLQQNDSIYQPSAQQHSPLSLDPPTPSPLHPLFPLQLCNDTLCAMCTTDPNTCDVCQPEYSLDPDTNTCASTPAAAEPAPVAVGSSTGPARGTIKSCPRVGWMPCVCRGSQSCMLGLGTRWRCTAVCCLGQPEQASLQGWLSA